ncbi:substrate-binding domain-containing protein [Natronospora cellulosivora (SeqCode)]
MSNKIISFKVKNIIFLHLILLFFLIGCENEETTNPLPPPITIGVSMATMDVEIFEYMKDAMYDNKERDNVNLIWLDANEEFEQQKQDIQKLIQEEVDIIIINPVESREVGELVKIINDAKIPVIALNRFIEEADLTGYINADNIEVGILQARYLVDQIDKSGKVIILKGDKRNNVAYEITQGNKAVLKNYINIRIVSEEWHEEWSDELAEETVRKALERHPDIKGILANNSPMALAAVEVLKEKGLINDVITVGGDATEDAIIAIAKGEHNAEIDKMPYLQGLSAFKAATIIARKDRWHHEMRIESGEYSIPVKITPVQLINEDNIILMKNRYPEIMEHLD